MGASNRELNFEDFEDFKACLNREHQEEYITAKAQSSQRNP